MFCRSINLQNFLFKIYTTRDLCFIQILNNGQKIFIDLYSFFKSSSIVLWASKFISLKTVNVTGNDNMFISKNNFFEMALKKNTRTEMGFFLQHENLEILEFSFDELLKCSKNIKQFYITYITTKGAFKYYVSMFFQSECLATLCW